MLAKHLPLNMLMMVSDVLRDTGTYLYLGILAITQKITIGTFSQMLSAGSTFHSSLQNLMWNVQEIIKRTNYAYEYVKFMNYPAAIEKGTDTMLFKAFDEDGVEFSGGEQQKIAIARALFRKSPVVILDEPTAALDPVAEYEIYRQFDTLVGGKTAIYISHRLSSCKFCDRIAVFSEGTIKEYGTHDELVLIDGGVYAEMFAAQAQYYR